MEKLTQVIDDYSFIKSLIPQREPIVMVDKLVFSDEKKTRSGLRISATNIFAENGFFTESGIIENIAQTTALRLGYFYFQLNQTPPPGYIGAIKNLVIYHLPEVGDSIETEVEVEQEIFGVTLVNGKVWLGSRLIAECEMKTAIQKEI